MVAYPLLDNRPRPGAEGQVTKPIDSAKLEIVHGSAPESISGRFPRNVCKL